MSRQPFGHYWVGGKLLEVLRAELPPYALVHLDSAVAGDAEEASMLAGCAAPNEWRGIIAVTFYLLRVPNPAFREALLCVWEHDHRELIAAAETRNRLRAMFRYADYPAPSFLPDTVQIWRGTSAMNPKKTARGLAWTVNRDIACWFSMRFADTNGFPVVLTAFVPRKSIMLYTNERSEQEVVVFDVPSWSVDGDPRDWSEGFNRVSEQMRQDREKLLAEVKANRLVTG